MATALAASRTLPVLLVTLSLRSIIPSPIPEAMLCASTGRSSDMAISWAIDGRLLSPPPVRIPLTSGLLMAGVPATLVSAADSAYRDEPSRLKVELDMLSWVLSVEEGSRASAGVPERMGVAGLTARGKREEELRERMGNPLLSALGLAGTVVEPGELERTRATESRRRGRAVGMTGAETAAWE
jgi:hypothetical protein